MSNIRFIGPDRQFSDIQTGTISECVEWCMSQKMLALDTETSGLDFISDRVLMLQIGNSEVQWCIDARYTSLEPFREIFASKEITKVIHNAKFDLTFLMRLGFHFERVQCTMLMEQVLTCGRDDMSASLQSVMHRRLELPMDKDERLRFINMQGESFSDSQIVYGCKDIEHLLSIRDLQWKELEGQGLLNVAILENEAVLAFADIEVNGMYVDSEEWMGISSEYAVKLKEIEVELDSMLLNDPIFKNVLPKYIQGDLFDEPKRTSTEWTSPKQALSVFRCIIPDLTDVNAKMLYLHRTKHPLIQKYIRYKEMQKIVSSYGAKFLETRKADGKVHTGFKQILNTGRVSSSGPNMQQIPSDNRFRNCFKAPEGWVFVSSDFSSQELNMIAFGAQDPVWLEALRLGHDLHSVCADLVFKERWSSVAEPDCLYMGKKEKCECKSHKKLRTQVKTINFMLAYGGGANKLADLVEIPKHEAQALVKEYFSTFPAIKNYLERLGKFGVRNGYSMTFPPFRRKRFYPQWHPYIASDEDSSISSMIDRASKNHPIQGSSADVTKLAMMFIRQEIIEHQLPVKMVMTVHDQIDTICREDFAEEWAQRLTAQMVRAGSKVITNGLLGAETTISKCWQK